MLADHTDCPQHEETIGRHNDVRCNEALSHEAKGDPPGQKRSHRAASSHRPAHDRNARHQRAESVHSLAGKDSRNVGIAKEYPLGRDP